MKFFEKLAKIKLLALDFDGIFTDGFVYIDQDGKETVRCSRKDGLGIDMLKAIGIEVVVISKETNKVVTVRCEKLKIKYWQGVDTGNDKLNILQQLAVDRNLKQEEIAYMGDDINDLPCIQWAGCGITVVDGDDKNKQAADIITNQSGGNHAVREICDLILLNK